MDNHERSQTPSMSSGGTLMPVTPQTLTGRQHEALANTQREQRKQRRRRWVKTRNAKRRRY